MRHSKFLGNSKWSNNNIFRLNTTRNTRQWTNLNQFSFLIHSQKSGASNQVMPREQIFCWLWQMPRFVPFWPLSHYFVTYGYITVVVVFAVLVTSRPISLSSQRIQKMKRREWRSTFLLSGFLCHVCFCAFKKQAKVYIAWHVWVCRHFSRYTIWHN